MKKKITAVICFTLLIFIGCRNAPPPQETIKKMFAQYYNSVNLPFKIESLEIISAGSGARTESNPVRIKTGIKILAEDNKTILYDLDNIYDSKFHRIVYGYWNARFSLVRHPPSDSTIFQLLYEHPDFRSEVIEIVSIDSFNTADGFYPVNISVNKTGNKTIYSIPFSQNEFGIWKIGKGELITPENTVREFFSEVNKGHTDRARRYFSYDYKPGYDDLDKKNLERLFPEGSIKDISITDVYIAADTSRLNASVVKTDQDTFKTDLKLIRLGLEWRIGYYGWNWKFKPLNVN